MKRVEIIEPFTRFGRGTGSYTYISIYLGDSSSQMISNIIEPDRFSKLLKEGGWVQGKRVLDEQTVPYMIRYS